MPVVSLNEQIAAVAREIALRRNVYSGFVARGKMKEDAARLELDRMQAVIETLKALQWKPPGEPPDADITVLLSLGGEQSEPVWPGYFDGATWYLADGMPAGVVKGWRHMPEGE